MPIAKPVNQNSTHPYQPQHYNQPPLVIVLTVILLVVFFIGFFALYFCKCFYQTLTEAWNNHYHNGSAENQNQSQQNNNPGLPPVNPGLEPHIIQSFPTFPFSSVKDLREDKCGLECAICLLEFEEEHILLRLLTTCYHSFKKTDTKITSKRQHLTRTTSNEVLLSRQSSRNNERKIESLPDKFSRSKTTGHSIVRNKPEEEDRYTLRLPDHVKIKVTRRHNNNQTESCISFGELMRNRGGRFGEVSGQSLVPESGS
ncbi:RING-H2 finger protein ATL30 [Cardamine amara subsp. amara]|uniref:RING-type E3 ubiquitin transferase n=1 Tax=Cardamine amara subsp. amara TaxID=228776 RepID=A0ABD1BKI8_CARAN